MPHKRNPVLTERLCGMSRLLRGHALVALEDVALWHERDISHSAAERVILPDAFAVLSYMLQLAARVVRGLRVDARRMRENVDWGGGLVLTQRVMTALIDGAGWPRERAYRTVQALALRAREGEAPFRDLVRGSEEVRAVLDAAQLDDALDASAYLRHVDETYRRLGLPLEAPSPATVEASRPELAVEAGLGGGKSS
jgi:adenylosuccinate lyase